jgi:mono/diheme cytochrome c family protein
MRRRPLPARLSIATISILPLVAGCVERSPGEKLYRKHCANCHGVDGSGNTPRYMGNQWANLIDDSWQNAAGDEYSLARVVREGVFAKMPGNAELSDDEVREIVGWVLQLRGETR